ncbi:MAG: tRNA epoxyqueuosine(34) reductase QueG [Rhodospirillum sp.]|nr:tRNA epoxyqueuosine(34) reductase QueG [Rhodospirillum sp.]MCF8490473.1 tRNA epoxyqueuosine(34) reductase QueG [Rhodospirillum sp.]MCF8500830.1 tRNA epoxyqueuosine(34) reductase QueG [Rhodospirillum sp.]
MAKPLANPEEIKDTIRARARELGFDACHFARATLPDSVRADLDGFLAEGRQGAMAWMADTRERRGDPRVLWPEAVTVLVLGLSYAPGHDPLALLDHPDRGAISVYARNRDYHDVAKGRAKTLAQWLVSRQGGAVKVFVDTAPVMEKPLAARSGLGWRGKHTNLVSRSHGSWLFLTEIFSTLDLPPDGEEGDHCGRCTRCLDVCPTGALTGPGRIDGRLCVSYLTIEHPGPIPRALRPLLGNRIYGCDDCLAVCPWNRFASPTTDPAFLPRVELTAPRLADLAELDDAGFRSLFSASPIKRIGRGRFVRNVLIALGNGGDPGRAETARRLVRDADPLVRGAAVWAFGQLAPGGEARSLARSRLAVEEDGDVLEELRVLAGMDR